VGLLVFLLTSIPVWLGISFGMEFVGWNRGPADDLRTDVPTACAHHDALHYIDIVENRYSYDPQRRSNVAFFPVYPLLARQVAPWVNGNARWALLLVANAMLLAAFVAFAAFLQARGPEVPARERLVVLALFGVWPAGLFFRMPYSEATFVFLLFLTLLGMARCWPVPVVALLAGLATAARPVGLAVTFAFAWHVFSDPRGGSRVRRGLRTAAWLPVASWGLLAYMSFQWYAFGTPLAFAQTQEHWEYMASADDNKVESLLSGAPVWSIYTTSAHHWRRIDCHGNPFFSLLFWNPILFVGAGVLLVVGCYQAWLTGPEAVLGFGLLAIPYCTRAHEMSMASHGRFAAVVVPAFLVMGRLLRSLPEWCTWSVLGMCSLLLMAWSALFVAGRPLF
jgi:hypothetical protein